MSAIRTTTISNLVPAYWTLLLEAFEFPLASGGSPFARKKFNCCQKGNIQALRAAFIS
jgi:hypothetical protein